MTESNSSNLEFEIAVSTLSEYGFSKALIKRTLKNILKVYAGNEGWPLIKENGYEVVIERLISDDTPRRRKSSRRVHDGLEKEKEQFNPDCVTVNAGVVPRSTKSSISSLLVRPILEMEEFDINSHQRNSWTRNGSCPLPGWFRELNVSKNDVQQKFSYLHVVLEGIDQDCLIQGQSRFPQKQESNSTSLKSKIFSDAVQRTNHAEASLPQCSLAMPQTKRVGDVDVSSGALDATGIKQFQRENCFGSDGKKRKREKTSKLQRTLYATERLDIARMSACKLTRRRDGGSNPMFSRLQKLKLAGAGASVRTHQQENLDLNASEGDAPAKGSVADEETRSKESPKLPPGFGEPSGTNEIALSGNIQGWMDGESSCHEDALDPVSPADSPEVPPGFWEPCDASQDSTVPGPIHNQDSLPSDESPLLPPGFSDAFDAETLQESPRRPRSTDSIPSDESPLLPPGFSDAFDAETLQKSPRLPHSIASDESPLLPPGFSDAFVGITAERLSPDRSPEVWELSGEGKETMSPVTRSDRNLTRTSQEENRCLKDSVKGKGTSPKQVFIATIPEGLQDAGQKLDNLVRELLQGFESVPLSARLPRKIQVRKDHAFVEFCCEAMAGVFVDAYLANVSAFRINGEQLLAARNIHLMKRDIKLRFAIASRLKGKVLDPRNVFYLGNVPLQWQNEERLYHHIASLLKEDASSTLISETLSVCTIPDFSDVFVHIQSRLLAETFFLRCLNDKDHMEEISTSLVICRNSTFLPRASRVCLSSDNQS